MLALGLAPHHTSLVVGYTRSGQSDESLLLAPTEFTDRFLCGRAREIQAQEGLSTPSMWGPPASGGSTPLRETIPESPSQDGFPDLVPPPEKTPPIPQRRTRAGTLPSRIGNNNVIGNLNVLSLAPKTSRPTPSSSPFRPTSMMTADSGNEGKQSSSSSNTSTLLSRLRAGSMPQRVSHIGSSSPFGSSVFSAGWGSGRDRATTLTSIRSSEGLDSPAQSTFSRDGLTDTDVKTLDYLGLAETPQQSRATLAMSNLNGMTSGSTTPILPPFLIDLATYNKNMSRYRSYSVNATEKYVDEDEEEYNSNGRYSGLHSGTLTPSAASTAAAYAVTQAQIHQHNLAVQAFAANQASVNRPRARTTGILDSPVRNSGRSYLTIPSRLDNSISAVDVTESEAGYEGLPESVGALHLASNATFESAEDGSLEGPTRALWLGSIPTSTTVSSLQVIFGGFGKIESTRVLVHKNCGFVNYEDIDCAIRAKASLNGKEIFPGAGPVRIGYAKAPSTSGGTPGANGAYPSPSPDPFSKTPDGREEPTAAGSASAHQVNGVHVQTAAAALHVPELPDLRADMLQIVREFGATQHDVSAISVSIDSAISYDRLKSEIPTVPEPSQTRVHDAPKLREIRKRIDNNAISPTEIEEIAVGMLPEIAELASDYLGNTVVQKLFEFCSEPVKEAMLREIAPHLAEIGVHKNGTWAAQKILDVAKTPTQIAIIVDSLRPYTVALFLDQFGNYVIQCCLRFGYPSNNFIFETMLSRLWEIAQGRYGARAMRACLESHHSTKDQQRMLASAISLHSVQLATNANGALLLTWLLDTCTFPLRRTILAPRLIPHLVHLCTHKVAYLTVLKVINQRNEPDARDTVLQALFFSQDDKMLEDILSDQTCGAALIYKVLITPFFDENMRAEVVQNVRTVLNRLKALPASGYKRLMDEVGLSSRLGGKMDRDHHSVNGSPYHDRSRPMSQQGSRPNHLHQSPMERQHSGQFIPTLGQQQFPQQPVISMDSAGLSGYDQFGLNSPVFPTTAINPQQMQYQQALLATSARGVSPGGFYPNANGVSLGNYGTPPPSFDHYRHNQSASIPQQQPISPNPMMSQNTFGPPGFSPMMTGGMMGGYQYPMQYFPQQQMQQPAGGRRGRVGYFVP